MCGRLLTVLILIWLPERCGPHPRAAYIPPSAPAAQRQRSGCYRLAHLQARGC